MEKENQRLDFEKPLHEKEEKLALLLELSGESDPKKYTDAVKELKAEIESIRREIHSNLSSWQRVQLSRHSGRPYFLDFAESLFENFEELHGDRNFGDDAAVVGGPASFEGESVMVIGQQKGRGTEENLLRSFGCPHPEGYRKALRLMRLAEKFSLPVLTFVDTPGAYPGVGAEERHVAEAIAMNIREMAALSSPVVTLVIGEGGSGGALGIAVADRVLIFENAYYSVISPEGCAAILWKDRKHAPEAADALCLGADQLLELGVVDEILSEPLGGAHLDWEATIATARESLLRHLGGLRNADPDELRRTRYEKFRSLGAFAGK